MEKRKKKRSIFTLLASIFLAIHPILYLLSYLPVRYLGGFDFSLTPEGIVFGFPTYELIIVLLLFVVISFSVFIPQQIQL